MSVANAVGKGGATDGDYGSKSQVLYNNNRSANHQTDYFGAVGGAIGSVISPLLDVLRPSRKENTLVHYVLIKTHLPVLHNPIYLILQIDQVQLFVKLLKIPNSI